MSTRYIMKSQKNDIFQQIQFNDLAPEDFEWKTIMSVINGSDIVSILVHKSTNYYFQFDFRGTDHYCIFSPGETIDVEQEYTVSWGNQILKFNEWLMYIKREIEAPDLWDAIKNESVLSNYSAKDNENTPFNSEEKQRIQESLNEIKHYLLSLQEFSPEQTDYLDARFNYLKDAADRVGKKDWVILVVGTLTNIIITSPLPALIARELFRMAGTVLQWFVRIPPLIN